MKYFNPRILTALAVMLVLALSFAVPAISAPESTDARPAFQKVVPELKKVKVPLRLPAFIPVESELPEAPGAPALALYASLVTSSPDSYTVILGYSQTCTGGNACRYGSVFGTKRSKSDPALKDLLNDVQEGYEAAPHKSKSAPAMVQLANGTQAVFEPWTCFNNCTDASITWDEGNYRYTIGVKVANKAGVLQMANSALVSK